MIRIRIERYETQFSINHAMLTMGKPEKMCWICLLPLGSKKDVENLRKSRDHVMPKRYGGACIKDGNIRWAHRICNSKRGHLAVTRELVRECREIVVSLTKQRGAA
jgi:hypothetical protein